MAQAGYTPIQLYYSTTVSQAPSAGNLVNGELAINITDGKLYYKDNSGVVQVIGTKGGVGSSTNTQVLFNSSGAVAGAAGLTWDGTNLTVNSIKDSALTSGRVTYAGASGLLQDSANLTWNGTGLGIGGVAAVTAQTFAAGSTLSWGTNLSTIDYIQAGSGSIALGTNGTAKLTIDSAGAVTLSGGTANGVAYLNGSKVLTTGSALTFDGSTLGLNNRLNFSAEQTSWAAYSIGRSGSAVQIQGGTNGFVVRNSGDTFNTYQVTDAGVAIWKDVSSELMRLTSTGLGIGTSSPISSLHVVGGVYTRTGTLPAPSTSATNSFAIGNGTGVTQFASNGSNNGAYGGFEFIGRKGDSSDPLTRLLLDSSGNLGLGVTPNSSWQSTKRVFQFGLTGALYGTTNDTPVAITTNTYYDGTNWKAIALSPSSKFELVDNSFKWWLAPAANPGANQAFSQAMTLDASGRLLIGGTSTYDFNGQANLVVNGTANNATITIASTGIGYLAFADGTSGTDRYAGRIDYDHASDFMAFNTAATERARITSGGYFKASNNGSYFGSAGAYHELRGDGAGRLFIFENYASSSAVGGRIHYSAQAPNNTGAEFLYCSDTGGERASIRSNGGIANYSANDVNLSDRREKTNVAPAKSYLDVICAIPVQTFNYIDQNLEEDPGTTLGVIAQDVQAVAPELVMESNWAKDGDEPKMRLSIYQTDLQYALMKCIQEQQDIITELRARISALEAK